MIGAAKPSSTPLSTARSAVHSSSQSTSHSTLDFAHVLQQESPQEVLENSPTAVVAAVAAEEVSPHPSLPLTARFYSPPLARKKCCKDDGDEG